MNQPTLLHQNITNFNELIQALHLGEKEIIIKRSLVCTYSVLLPEGVVLKGKPQEDGELPLVSFINSDGFGVSANNTITDLNIDVSPQNKAIYTTINPDDLGILSFKNLHLKGQISILIRAGVNKGEILLDQINIIASDSRHYLEQPQKYGVNVLQGALTIYNLNPDENSLIQVTITNLSIGQKNAPVTGSGIFIAGYGDQGGKTKITKLHTKAVYSNGKIPPGVSDYISAGVFILNGAFAEEVITDGEIITYGINDMVLDVWGTVENWTSNKPVISYGPSGVGFVNFGIVKNFTVNAPLQTYGLGARGYNQYDGTVENIRFKSIETFGDGSVGVQISKKIGTLTIEENITTHGSVGSSLVKGHYVDLPAYALSIKDGGVVDQISIKNNIETKGDHVTSYLVEQGGIVKQINIDGAILAEGKNSIPQQLA